MTVRHSSLDIKGKSSRSQKSNQAAKKPAKPSKPGKSGKPGLVQKTKVKVKKNRDGSVRSVFDLDRVNNPLVGTPAEVQDDLDNMALRLQKRPNNQELFMKIVCYMHKYILGLVFKKYSFVTGSEEKDMYQEALIALHRKAIPGFRNDKGMSFLNFAKMCINRHLITILHASRNRRKDLPLNTAISLDHNPGFGDDEEDTSPLSNVIVGRKHAPAPYEQMDRDEVFGHTLRTVKSKLSSFEQTVLDEYLDDKSYKEASKSINKKHIERCNEKSIDNALLRIRKKAIEIRDESGDDDLPLLHSPIT